MTVYGLYAQTTGDVGVTGFQRLTDLINLQSPYLPLEEAVFDTRGSSKKSVRTARILLNKQFISLVVPTGPVSASEVSAVAAQDLRVQKIARDVHITAPFFLAEAAMHLVEGADLQQYLNLMRDDFVPLTKVRVHEMRRGPRTKADSFQSDFALLNKRSALAIRLA